MADQSPFPPPTGSGVAFVTGGFGFLGAAAAAALHAAGWRVAVIGHPPRHPPGPPLDATFTGAVGEPALAYMGDAVGVPDLVFHAAGGASVGASLANSDRDRSRTVDSLRCTLEFLRTRAPQARLIYPSSAAVYGAAHDGPIAETATMAPISPYGAHKAKAEALIREAAGEFGLSAVILRFFSIYGPGLRKQLLWELAGRLAAAPAEVELAGTGEERRDFLYIDDALALIGLAAGAPRGGEPLIVNGGSGRPASVREVAEGLAAAMGARSRITFNGHVREGDPTSLVADVSRAKALGFEPAVPLKTGLERVASWFASIPIQLEGLA